MRVLVVLLSLSLPAASLAQVADGFDADAYAQVEGIFFRTDSAPVATIRTGHLSRALAALERSNAHRVLMHGAWIQPVSVQPRPVLLSGGGRGEVGFLSVTREGFFKAEVRIWRPLGAGYAELHEVRPMRGRRAYYFDHPLMGVVLRIDPIRVPSEFR